MSECQKAILMHKIVNGNAPQYLSKLSVKEFGSTIYDFRSSNNLQIPKVRTKSYHDCFSVSGPILWNSLPKTLRNEKSLSKFKKDIRKHKFCIDNTMNNYSVTL